MRNYIQVFAAQWFAPTVGKSGHSIALTNSGAVETAQIFANNNSPGDPANFVIDQGKFYMCLNKQAVIGYFTAGTLTNDSVQETVWQNANNLNLAEGFELGESPKHSRDWPTSDGAKFTSKTGTGPGLRTSNITLASYLALLLNTWLAGITPAPKRWIDWLTQLEALYLARKLTATQVYALLALIDFSAATPPLPR